MIHCALEEFVTAQRGAYSELRASFRARSTMGGAACVERGVPLPHGLVYIARHMHARVVESGLRHLASARQYLTVPLDVRVARQCRIVARLLAYVCALERALADAATTSSQPVCAFAHLTGDVCSLLVNRAQSVVCVYNEENKADGSAVCGALLERNLHHVHRWLVLLCLDPCFWRVTEPSTRKALTPHYAHYERVAANCAHKTGHWDSLRKAYRMYVGQSEGTRYEADDGAASGATTWRGNMRDLRGALRQTQFELRIDANETRHATPPDARALALASVARLARSVQRRYVRATQQR